MPDAGSADYSLYLLRCADGTLYTGIARDVDARLAEHCHGRRGAKYLAGRGPVTIVFRQAVGDRSRAQTLEYRVKKLPRQGKLSLIAGELGLDDLPG
jgi:putative endonuclease